MTAHLPSVYKTFMTDEKDTDIAELKPAILGEIKYCPECGKILLEDIDCPDCGWCDSESD